MKLRTLVTKLESFAPTKHAESWDNVGLLLESSSSPAVKKVLTTIDLTEPVLIEAKSKQCSMILSYHPPIFSSFKRLTQDNAKSRIIINCVVSGISIYSPHTAWDARNNGVNDWIVNCLSFKRKVPITPAQIDGAPSTTCGMGRIVTLKSPLSLTKACETFKQHLGVSTLRLGHADPLQWVKRHKDSGQDYDVIRTVAVCAGSGGSLLKGVDADLYVTGEMSHHEVLAVIAEGRNVLLSEHTHTERGYLKYVVEELTKHVAEDVEFIVSESDMVVRPESPVEYHHEIIDEEWFKEYEWMNEEDTFEEAYLENLYLEELKRIARDIDAELDGGDILCGGVQDLYITDDYNKDICDMSELITCSTLNPNAAEFVPNTCR
eukprot:sb/3465715/